MPHHNQGGSETSEGCLTAGSESTEDNGGQVNHCLGLNPRKSQCQATRAQEYREGWEKGVGRKKIPPKGKNS